jgi:hypothetical protein
MKKTIKALGFVVFFLFISCTVNKEIDWGVSVNGESGFQISLKLPVDDGACNFPESSPDLTYCITTGDSVKLSIFSTPDASENYLFDNTVVFKVSDNSASDGSFNVSANLIKNEYYRFYVEVADSNGKLKMTGGISGFYFTGKNSTSIFLAPAGDFARIVSNRKSYYDSSLKSYFESEGSKGTAAVALKNGTVYLSGGHSFASDLTMKTTMIFDMKTLSSNKVADLNHGLFDHAAAFLDDGSESGKVIVAFGKTDTGENSNEILMYDPETDKYENLHSGESLTGAKAVTIDGSVYITGGCDKTSNNKKVYKVDKETLKVSELANLNTGRCNHAIADVSTVKEDGTVIPGILVIGGSIDEEGKTPVLSDLAEIISGGKSTPVQITARYERGNDNIFYTGLVSGAAVTLKIDDMKSLKTAVVLTGGFFPYGEGENVKLIANPAFYILSLNDDGKWVYDISPATYQCARPSAGRIGSVENSGLGHFAVNCGTRKIDRNSQSLDEQKIFITEIRKTFDKELEEEVFAAYVKNSLMEENQDAENGILADGPLAVDESGQTYIFGTEFVYQAGGYSIPKQ